MTPKKNRKKKVKLPSTEAIIDPDDPVTVKTETKSEKPQPENNKSEKKTGQLVGKPQDVKSDKSEIPAKSEQKGLTTPKSKKTRKSEKSDKSNGEMYAGATFQNSPLASSLPIPSFTPLVSQQPREMGGGQNTSMMQISSHPMPIHHGNGNGHGQMNGVQMNGVQMNGVHGMIPIQSPQGIVSSSPPFYFYDPRLNPYPHGHPGHHIGHSGHPVHPGAPVSQNGHPAHSSGHVTQNIHPLHHSNASSNQVYTQSPSSSSSNGNLSQMSSNLKDLLGLKR